MFSYISGTLAYCSQNLCVIDNHGIGWQLTVSDKTAAAFSKLQEEKKEIKAFTYLSVREDAMELFGFSSGKELDLFRLLITVSGVGPKAGIAILSALDADALCMCILQGDAKGISQAQGVGLKTAQKIILELKDKISRMTSSAVPSANGASPAGGAGFVQEAVNALVVLGYPIQLAAEAVSRSAGEAKDLQDLIRRALRNLSEK